MHRPGVTFATVALVMSSVALAACGSDASSPKPFGKPFRGAPARASDVSAAAFALPPDARLLLPAGVLRPSPSGDEAAWLAVDGRPGPIWRQLQQRVERRYVNEDVETSRCGPDQSSAPRQIYSCEMRLRGTRSNGKREIFQARLWRTRDDVTGSYLLRISTAPPTYGLVDRSLKIAASDAAPMPAPSHRKRPGAGDRVAPSSDHGDRRLLADSELVAVYGAGSITGGFDAVLRVRPGVDALSLARRYHTQSSGTGPVEESKLNGRPELIVPSGGGTGHTSVLVVDQPGDTRDLLVFASFND